MTKKIFSTIVLAFLVSMSFTPDHLADAANLTQAASTLSASEEWSIMAHASVGENVGSGYLATPLNSSLATDYEKRILAITAIGANPQTISSENFVTKLESFANNNQLGDTGLLNDDIFGILALVSAGISDSVVSNSRQYILSHQNSDGGWGFGTGIGSDSNTTAMAVAALAATGSVPSSATDYLYRSQATSGGFSYTPGTEADGASTAWVISGLISAGRSVPAEAKTFLENLQLSDGSFKWHVNDNSGSALVTAYAVIALSGHGLPIGRVTSTPPAQNNPPTQNNPPAQNNNPPATQNPPSSSTVQLCVHINYQGGCESFTGHDADLRNNQIGNDNASSIIVPAGSSAALYQHVDFQGDCEQFTTSDPDLRDNRIGNDTVSSIQLGGCTVTTPAVVAQPIVIVNPPPTAPAPIIGVRITITYPGNKIYFGDQSFSSNLSALQALTNACNQINLLREIKQTSFGQFVSSIDGYGPIGTSGWQYAVNGTVPSVGAADYQLKSGDLVQWFYGSPNANPY